MVWNGKKVLVIGTGKSGIASAKLLVRSGAEPVLFDSNPLVDRASVLKNFTGESVPAMYAGSLPGEVIDGTETVVLSPGVPLDNPDVERIRKSNKEIIGEIELAWTFEKGSLLAVTGTNGKTTTTTLLGEIMKNYCREKGRAFVVGNIGEPYTDIADETDENSVTVAEISSFQLETVKSFHPRVSAILNLTPDHLNRHKTMAGYVAAKERIFERQGEEDTVVLNYDDALTRDAAGRTKSKVVFFTRQNDFDKTAAPGDFLHLEDKKIYYNEIPVVCVDELKLIGVHNYENVMAAVGMAASFGVPMDIIRETVRSFKAVEHRIEFVRRVNGVDYYNDSKGTNPDAAIKAVEAMSAPTVLIGGGYDKRSSYDEWIESFGSKVRALVLLGETADAIEKAARDHGFTEIHRVNTLEEAVRLSATLSKPRGAVLLSPACASWDMFKSYEERGRLFKEYVASLKEED
ncbi:MAG: UDP-N-acetylmuramoyl-L-alanine--D-glutamate ligase [Lachnospiraceae bacterium]|nr:UDP-N-acetylmuramoyl-L-alanine--D-glutamate ligase [Lachnospiraceae bacterium]